MPNMFSTTVEVFHHYFLRGHGKCDSELHVAPITMSDLRLVHSELSAAHGFDSKSAVPTGASESSQHLLRLVPMASSPRKTCIFFCFSKLFSTEYRGRNRSKSKKGETDAALQP